MSKIISIEELENVTQISEMCHKEAEPILITKNGCGDMVVMTIDVYEQILNPIKMYQELDVSEADIREGKVKDAREVISDIREKYEL